MDTNQTDAARPRIPGVECGGRAKRRAALKGNHSQMKTVSPRRPATALQAG